MGDDDLDLLHVPLSQDDHLRLRGYSRATVEVIEIGQPGRPPDPQLSGATRL